MNLHAVFSKFTSQCYVHNFRMTSAFLSCKFHYRVYRRVRGGSLTTTMFLLTLLPSSSLRASTFAKYLPALGSCCIADKTLSRIGVNNVQGTQRRKPLT